jgi:hypothetical protein
MSTAAGFARISLPYATAARRANEQERCSWLHALPCLYASVVAAKEPNSPQRSKAVANLWSPLRAWMVCSNAESRRSNETFASVI